MLGSKKALQRVITVSSALLLMTSTLLPTLGLLGEQVVTAATTSTGVGTIAPGTSWDTGNHTYASSDFTNMSNFTLAGNDNPAVAGNTWFNLVNNGKNKVGMALFNGALDMTKGVSVSGQLRATSGSSLSGDWTQAGDSLGFILTPASTATINSNLTNSTGPGLGIQVLPNSYFLGRDLYSNLLDSNGLPPGPDGQNGQNGWQNGAGDVAAIRHTSATGTLDAAAYPSGDSTTTTNGTAYQRAQDKTGLLGGNGYQITENMTVTWTPDATNTATTAGYVSGTLNLKIYQNNSSTTVIANLTTKTSVYQSMKIGVVGATGGNYGYLSYNNNSTFSGGRGQSAVTVNYYKTGTTTPVSNWTSSSINANVEDKIAMLAPGSNFSSSGTIPSVTYNYVAPAAPEGYT